VAPGGGRAPAPPGLAEEAVRAPLA